MNTVFPIFDIVALVISSFIIIKCVRRLHESSLYVYIALIFVFYITPIFIDHLYAFPEYIKYHGYKLSSTDTATRIVYDICIVICMWVLYYKGRKRISVKSSSSISIRHKWTWIGSIIAPLSVIVLLRNPSLLFAFQWRELDLLELGGSRAYLFIESLTYIGICTSCFLLLDSKKSFDSPLLGRVLAAILLFMNICVEGKRAALFFAILVIVLIVVFKYIEEVRQLRKERKTIGFKVVLTWMLAVTAVFAAVYFMYQFSIDVKIERGYSEETEIMVEAFRLDALRDDRVRMSIYSQLNPDKMNILSYPGQTIWDCFKYLFPLSMVYGRIFSPYMYQHYFTAAVYNNPLSAECSMTVSIFAELVSNFGIIIGLFAFIGLTMFFVKISDKSPRPFNILFLCCFVMINLFDLSYGMLMIEFCAIMYYFNMKVKTKKIRNESTVVFKH